MTSQINLSNALESNKIDHSSPKTKDDKDKSTVNLAALKEGEDEITSPVKKNSNTSTTKRKGTKKMTSS